VKFRVERDVLADAVAWAARTLPARPPVPVLAGLLLTAQDDALVLSSFDYEVSARVQIAADVTLPGRALVSGRLLADICRSLPAAPVELVVDAGKAVLTSGKARFSLLTLPVEEYPELPAMPSAAGTVPGDVLAAAVAQVAVAAGRDDTLPVLTGVRVEIDGETVTLAATDRYRLAVREFRWTPESSGTGGMDGAAVTGTSATGAPVIALVPARTLSDTAKTLASAGTVTIALAALGARGGGTGDGLVGFEGNGRRTTSRLLDGEFPKYRNLFPGESVSVARVATAALIESVRRVALVAERNTPVRLSFSAADGEVTLEAGTGDEAQASESLEAELDGEDISIAFNPTYLLDGLNVLDAPVAQFSFTVPTRPAVLSGHADGDTGGATAGPAPAGEFRYLLMPIRLSG
jgi:DNA polymerase-3 subunit beta